MEKFRRKVVASALATIAFLFVVIVPTIQAGVIPEIPEKRTRQLFAPYEFQPGDEGVDFFACRVPPTQPPLRPTYLDPGSQA